MLKLKDGRDELFQWDTNRFLVTEDGCSELHFSNGGSGRSIDVEVVNNEARIPDELLQTTKAIKVWCFYGSSDDGYTKCEHTFKIKQRNKPADYVFTPTEQKTLEDFTSETWVFEMEDGQIIEKKVVIM